MTRGSVRLPSFRRLTPATALLCALALAVTAPAAASTAAAADVVVIVDTSTSMKNHGMDPQRTSLLVAKLLADIVPGELAVVRLLDIDHDSDVLPHTETMLREPCTEDPTKTCIMVAENEDWEELARDQRLGVLPRPQLADGQFKDELDDHLAQIRNNSMFTLAFRAAQGVFESHAKAAGDGGEGRDEEVPRIVFWLSDGTTSSEHRLLLAVHELRRLGVEIRAFVFGGGDTALAQRARVDVERVSTPAELMKAFADGFRHVVQAPFKVDGVIQQAPSFEMKPTVAEAWVVVYGDTSLSKAWLEGPAGQEAAADHAVDSLQEPGQAAAGAYRVAYLRRPAAGRWTVRVEGGGGDAAYAVIQRSNLMPVLLAPEQTLARNETELVAAIKAGVQGELLAADDLPEDLTLTARFEGQSVLLAADGAPQADGTARFRATTSFPDTGHIPVELELASSFVNRRASSRVEVLGHFSYLGEAVTLDLGTVVLQAESCRPLAVDAEHAGAVPFELRALNSPPHDHALEVRLPDGTLAPDSPAVTWLAGGTPEVCLVIGGDAPSSTAEGEEWLELRVAGSDAPGHRVRVALRWQVDGLSWLDRWGWLLWWIFGVLAAAFLAGGFIVPKRLPRSLAVAYVPERDELDEQSAQPVRQWKGVRIGFYRNARAFLQGDFRISGNPRGALAVLLAESGGARVMAGKGSPLFRETIDGDWEPVTAQGQRTRGGQVYRVGERGPFFRITRGQG